MIQADQSSNQRELMRKNRVGVEKRKKILDKSRQELILKSSSLRQLHVVQGAVQGAQEGSRVNLNESIESFVIINVIAIYLEKNHLRSSLRRCENV